MYINPVLSLISRSWSWPVRYLKVTRGCNCRMTHIHWLKISDILHAACSAIYWLYRLLRITLTTLQSLCSCWIEGVFYSSYWAIQPSLHIVDVRGAKSLCKWIGLVGCIVAVYQIHEGINNASPEGWILQETVWSTQACLEISVECQWEIWEEWPNWPSGVHGLERKKRLLEMKAERDFLSFTCSAVCSGQRPMDWATGNT